MPVGLAHCSPRKRKLFEADHNGSVLQRKISKPIRDLAFAMHEVTERHEFTSRVSVSGSDEIAQLGTGFNIMLGHTGLPPNRLQIELTESVMLSRTSRVAESMNRLRALGVSLAIDDFGTGYSCLGYLPRLPFDALKIDRSFVNEIGTRPEIKAMVHSLVTLAYYLGMRVVVEGIETQKQLELITELGGNEIQGYLLGRPTPDPGSLLLAYERSTASRDCIHYPGSERTT